MSTKHKRGFAENLSIGEAVETLSRIADIEVDGVQNGAGEQEEKKPYQVLWLSDENQASLPAIKNVFRSVLHYLKQFYSEQQGKVHDEQASKGIRTIMVLVGEAAERLEKCSKIFADVRIPRVSELREYQQLQHFYTAKLAPRIDEGKLGRWILALSQQALERKSSLRLKPKEEKIVNKHIFIDIDTVKKDMDYELFFMRKEDGTRFFSPRLIRNIKLVSGVGSYFPMNRQLDSLAGMDLWLDSFVQKSASDMVAHLRPRLDTFFHEALRHKGKELVEEVSKAIMALLLSASPTHLKSRHSTKSCLSYFKDFQNFLSYILNSRAYQKLIVYPPQSSNRLACCLHDTILALCRALYLYGQGLQSMRPVVKDLTQDEGEAVISTMTPLSDTLAASYATLQHKLRQYTHGPLAKIIQLVSEGNYTAFDPLTQINLPTQMYVLYVGKQRILHTRMPSPVIQEYIHKAVINEEFKGFLLSCAQGHTVKKHLAILMQDYTSWRESARCHALEALHHHRDFGQNLDIAVLAINNDFYQQTAPYHQDHHADVFKRHLIEHLCDEQAGFWFPVGMRTTLFRAFFSPLLEAIHRIFFHDKNVLSRESRMAFIDLCYLFTCWKLIELSGAHAFSLLSKDGIDTGASYGAALFSLCQWLMGSRQANDVFDYLQLQVLAPALLWRERAMLPETFKRLIVLLRTIESCCNTLGNKAFHSEIEEQMGALYDWPWLQGEINWPGPEVVS